MNYAIEVLILPVRDVDRARAFYTDQAGFTLDVDYAPTNNYRVVQLTPPGSKCSVQIGVGLIDAPPGSVRGIYMVVDDLQAALDELHSRGVAVSEVRHKHPVGTWQGAFRPGLEPQRTDYASFADFSDPDGNQWTLQERGFRG
jgi:catechol 2,3-dioxygenase-like lactoylglutathione lyase family enzyme